ncbi:MAG: ATP-dependent 6-phosphofructokinase [Actinomycetota bacterium]|nr:ATP-dependent 6-phosphofructokinase [Actinomycetota bacterium]
MTKSIGILTAGGDSPGLNAAIRAIGKSAIRRYGWNVLGFQDGFRGLMQNRFIRLDSDALSAILTRGGTILGTGRDKPHRMEVGGSILDMTDVMLENFQQNHLDALVCIGGGGTHKNALRLIEKGMPIVTLPKTIDNDLVGTDGSLGFDTALGIATEAIDRLHSTAHSHHRIIVVEIMGHNAGWLTLASGLGGGADVILIPEIPYSVADIANAIAVRKSAGSMFSIVAVAEGAISVQLAKRIADIESTGGPDARANEKLAMSQRKTTVEIAKELEESTGLDSRVTILGHVQRGGSPSPMDRVLATKLGTAAIEAIQAGETGVMIASRGEGVATIPVSEVANRTHLVPADHPWIEAARALGVCMGDEV